MKYEDSSVTTETQDRVYNALEREADMDGVVIVGEEYLGRQIGLSGHSVGVAIRMLCDRKKLSVTGHASGPGRTRIIKILDSD